MPSPSSTDAVDPDDQQTWPDRLRAAASLSDAQDAELFSAALLDDRPLRAYHGTRLLPHEVDGIRRDGLRALSAEHIAAKLESAERAGAISANDRARLAQRQVFSPGSITNWTVSGRRDRVCAVVGLTTLTGNGLNLQLCTWGGEAIYSGAEDLKPQLSRIGTPTVVVLDLQLTRREFKTWGPVMALFAGLVTGEEPRVAEIHVLDAVAASEIVAIWQPGMPQYDSLTGLPPT